jgi:hypothetical protein
MKNRIISLLILLALLLVNVSAVLAYALNFQVESLDVEFIIQQNGTATIDLRLRLCQYRSRRSN